jgi:hypothetical protein
MVRPTAPGPIAGYLLEWRAQQIADPVARLRFLRRATRLSSPAKLAFTPGTALALAAAVVVLMILPFGIRATLGWTSASRTESSILPAAVAGTLARLPDVWIVEQKDEFEIYSNGLRIETRGAAKLEQRRYFTLDRRKPESWVALKPHEIRWQRSPAGIVFHTTESDLAPFEAGHNQRLQRVAKGVVAFVREHRAYHYVIDRFGRVHRTVQEESSANHAGWSVWADSMRVYLNLNHSFLGVAFEAQTRPQDGSDAISVAQVRAGQMLTEMLRAKYRLAAENCVTHGQVSVNPSAFLVGAHTDWAARFPYGAMGLPDNYAQPIPSITLFGFSYNNIYVSMSGASLWKGLLLADEEMRQNAAAKGVKLAVHRAILNRRYKEMVELIKRVRTEDGN